MTDAAVLLRPIAEMLDSLGVAACAFDDADNALLWNRTFLKLFPEHAAHIRLGEPYRDNLRRFYESRLDAAEMPRIDLYIDEGVARHRSQQRPHSFQHHGVRLTVASLPMPGIGRIRMWRPEAETPTAQVGSSPVIPGSPMIPGSSVPEPIEGAAAFDCIADGVMVTSAGKRIVWVNEPFVVMYGFADRASTMGVDMEGVYRTAWAGLEDAERDVFEQGLAALADNMHFPGAPFEMPLPAARWTRISEQHSPDGKSFFLHVDITMLKRQQRQVQDAERRTRDSEVVLKAILERMEQGIILMNADRIVEVCNRRAIELLGLPEELMASKPKFDDVLAYQWSKDEFKHTAKDVQEFIKSGLILDRPNSYDRRRPDGRIIEVLTVPMGKGGALRTYTDITDRKMAEEKVRHVARHDGLTSLVNRAVFLELLQAAIDDSARTHEEFAVHYIDIDSFKPINDGYGHAIGDKVLALLADRMRGSARDVDVVARMGGDEFAILQYGTTRTESAKALASRVLRAVALPIEIETYRASISASIGTAHYPGGGTDADTLVRNADSAMYAAKLSGGGSARVFEPA